MSLVPFTVTLPSTLTGFDDLAPAGATAVNPTTSNAPVSRIPNLRPNLCMRLLPRSTTRRVLRGRPPEGLRRYRGFERNPHRAGSRSTAVWTVSDETLVAG